MDLPIRVDEIIAGVDRVMISHLHPDHFDETARGILPKEIFIFCDPTDECALRNFGFTRVRSITDAVDESGIRIHRSTGHHGEGLIETVMGNACGFVFEHPEEKALYWTGDTVWCREVLATIRKHSPSVIVCHAGGNRFVKEHPIFGEAFSGDSPPVTMDAEQLLQTCQHAPNAEIVATHIGALDHESETRESLARAARSLGSEGGRIHLPCDGQTLRFLAAVGDSPQV